jgi:hypothetical protein
MALMALVGLAFVCGAAFEIGRAVGLMVSNRMPARWFGIDGTRERPAETKN